MARLPRLVAPGLPHPMTRRGNQRETTFFTEDGTSPHRDGLAETVGRPVGDRAWLQALEKRTGRSLLPDKRGPKAKATE